MSLNNSKSEMVLRRSQNKQWQKFLRGLEPSIAKKVDIQPCWSFEGVCKLTIKVEKYSKREEVVW